MAEEATIYKLDKALNTGLEAKTDVIITYNDMRIVNTSSNLVLVAVTDPSEAVAKRVAEGNFMLDLFLTVHMCM